MVKKHVGFGGEEESAGGAPKKHIKEDVIVHTNEQIQMVIDSIIPKTQKLKE